VHRKARYGRRVRGELMHEPAQIREAGEIVERRTGALIRVGIASRSPARREIPQLDHTIVAARDDPAPIGREGDLPHTSGVALVRLNARLAPNIPNLEIRVDRARGKEFAVGMPLRGMHTRTRSAVMRRS